MKSGWLLGFVCAVVAHALVLLFGGVFFLGDEQAAPTFQEVELLDAADVEQEEKEAEATSAEESALQTEPEAPPDSAELLRELAIPANVDAPALEAMSLGAIEAALDGQGGGAGEFADAFSFTSGGRIGGTGKAGVLEEKLDEAFGMAEIDQKPRAVFQSAPLYPSELRGKKVEGVVTLIFVVDASGKVSQPRVEKSTHPAFEKPAIDAVKQWKFEPAVKAGQRVGCRMRLPIRFQPS